jgi:uncharacterized membrane protein
MVEGRWRMVDEVPPKPRAKADGRRLHGRLDAVDALRGFAILLMILVHVARAVVTSGEPGAVGAIRSFLMTVEPYISTLFLTLAGVSLVLARRACAATGDWWKRRLYRAVQLVLLSWVIFWVHGGVNLPYPFLSAEILYTIGLAILVYAPVVGRDGIRWWLLAGSVAALSGATALAEHNPGVFLSRLAQGPGAHLPNLLFPALGIGLAWCWGDSPGRGRIYGRRCLVVSAAVVLVWYHAVWGAAHQDDARARGGQLSNIEAVFNRPFGRVAHARELVTDGEWGSTYDLRWVAGRLGLADPPPRIVRSRSFWNKKLVLVPYLASWMLVTFGVAYWLAGRKRLGRGPQENPQVAQASAPPGLPAGPLYRPLHLLGRHPLELYVLHLVLAAVLSIVPGKGLGISGYVVCVLGTLAVCAGVALLLERHRPVAPAGTR